MFESNVSISSSDQDLGFFHEIRQMNNFKAMLKGVPPPSSITISKITVEDMLYHYKVNEKSFGLGLTSEKGNFIYNEEYSIPFLNFLNSSCNAETIASLMQKVQERYIQLETLSSCNIWFKSILQSIDGANKHCPIRQNVGVSPSRRLSHLARRRQYFSCANLQQIANFEKTRLIEIRKNKYEGNYKKITQNIKFEKLNSSKRALFLSPEGETPKKYESFRGEERKPFSPKYDENKRLPTHENNKKLQVSKWLSEQNFNIDFPKKRLRDECLNHTLETKRKCPRRSLNFENEVPFSSNNMTVDKNFSDKKTSNINKLSQKHKNKLLWAVSIVLKENNILRSDEIFKVCASTLFHKCRKNLNEIFSLQTANGTSEKMLQYARSQISSIFQELNIPFQSANNVSEESKAYVENNLNLMSKLTTKFSSMIESKENIPKNKVDENHLCSLDAELDLLFKTPRKVSRRRTIKSCQKEAAKINKKIDNLKRCRSLDSLISTNAEISFSNVMEDLKECKLTYNEKGKNDKAGKLINSLGSDVFEANTFINTSKNDLINISELAPSDIEYAENNERSNDFSNSVLKLADKDFSLTFSPIPSSVKNFDSPVSLFPALCLNSYDNKESFEYNNYTPNSESSHEIFDQDEEMKSQLVSLAENENTDHENQHLKFQVTDINFNEENESGTVEKDNLKPYNCLEADVCDISTKSYKEADDQKPGIDNFSYEIRHSDNYINKCLTDSTEKFDKLTVRQSSCLSDKIAFTDISVSDQVARKNVDTNVGNECNLMVSSNSPKNFENISSPSPGRCSVEKGNYKPRKLVVKKSKSNWKVVRQNSVESENNSNLKLKMRLSHEWEVIRRTSCSSDVTNNSENEENSFSSPQVFNINDDRNCREIQVESERDFSNFSFHEDIETTHALNCSGDKLISNLDHSDLKVQSNKISESMIADNSDRSVSLDVDVSISSFVTLSCKTESSFSKEDSSFLENEEVNGELQESNPLTMNLSQDCIIGQKHKVPDETEKYNRIKIYPDILNKNRDSLFFNFENGFMSRNKSEFHTNHTENLIASKVSKEKLSNGHVNRYLCNEKNKDILEVREPRSLFEEKTDQDIKTRTVDKTLDKEVLYETTNVMKKPVLYDYYFERKDNCKDYQLNNTQKGNKSIICLRSPTIFNASYDSSSFKELENIYQSNEKNSPNKYKTIDTLYFPRYREEDNISHKQLGSCASNFISDQEKNGNSLPLSNSKPTERFLTIENYNTRNHNGIEDLQREISQSEKTEEKMILPKQDNCNLKSPKKKKYNIELEHSIGEHMRKTVHKDKFRKSNLYSLKEKTDVSNNIIYSDLMQEKQTNNTNLTFNDDSLATYDINTNRKDKFILKNKELLKAPISKSESNPALQYESLNCNNLSNLNSGEGKAENINVQTIVSALSALSTLVEEQIKFENENVKTKQFNKEKQEFTSKPENLKNNWLDVVSYWCGKNLNNLKSQSDLLSDSYKFADNDMNVMKHFEDIEKSQNCEIKIKNLKKNILSKDFIKKHTAVKCQKQQNDNSPSQQSNSKFKNECKVSEPINSDTSLEEIRSTVFKEISNFFTDTNDNARFYMNETSHSLNHKKSIGYKYNTIPINPINNGSDTFNVPELQVENSLHQSDKYSTLKCHSIQHYLKPMDIDCEFMAFRSDCIRPQNYLWDTNEGNHLFHSNMKHLTMQSNQTNAYHDRVLSSNTGFFQGEYDRHSTIENSNLLNSYFQYSSTQTPLSIETKNLETANDSAISVYNSHYLMKSLWSQSNLQDQLNCSRNQQLFENFTGKFPFTLDNFKASYHGSQNAPDVHMQFKSPNTCIQKQSSMFYQFNNVYNVYSSWQFPLGLNSCNYKQNVLNGGFQNSSEFSYRIPNIPQYVNYFR